MTFAFQNLPRDFALDDNLAALPAAKLYVYDAGTSTPRTIYSNAAGSATHTNPLVADGAGRFAAWFLDPDDGDYKVVLKTSADVTIYTVDNLPVTPITATEESTPSAPSTPVNVKTSSFTLSIGEIGEVQNIDPTSGDVTVTLLSATGVTDGYWTILRHKGTAGAVIITDGGSFRRILRTPGESVTLVSDAVHWYMIAEGGELAIASHGDIIVADRLATPPTAPSPGTRYLATSGASSPWTEDYIYEANGSGGWIEYIPASGWACWVTDEELRTVYDGSDWTDWSNTTAPTTSELECAEIYYDGTGTNSLTSGAWTTVPLATQAKLSITGASFASNKLTLPTGYYLVYATASLIIPQNSGATAARTRLYSVTNTATKLTSTNESCANVASQNTALTPTVFGYVSVTAATEEFRLDAWINTSGVSLGGADSSSEAEKFANLIVLDLTSIQGPQGTQGASGSGYGGTSTSSVAIGSSGTKTWTTQSGYAYVTGQRVRVSYDASNWIEGTVSSYSGTTFAITADSSDGSGTYTSWTIGVAGQPGADGATGATGDAGSPGPTGDPGATGATGPSPALDYAFSTSTSGDPGTGKVAFNNASWGSATVMRISKTDRNTASRGGTIATWDDSTNSSDKAAVTVFTLADRSETIDVTVTGSLTDNSTYYDVPITVTAASVGMPSNGDIVGVPFARTGNKGTDGAGVGDALVADPLSQFAATTSAQLAGVISDETGTGALVFANSPTLVTPALGTPASGTLTNCTGLPQAGTVGLTTADSPQFAAVNLGHASDTTLSRSAAGELAVEGTLVKKVGKETVWVPSAAMITRTTNGAAAGTVETTTNKIMFSTLDFDTTTQEFAQFAIRMPKSWNESTVTAAFTWSHAATSTNFGVVWALEAVALSDDDAGDAAFGTAQQVADTGGTTNDVYVTSATSAITIAGSPAAEDWVVFQVKRVPSDGSDTMAIDARLHGVTLYFTTDASTDA